jgi:hypothetical protein
MFPLTEPTTLASVQGNLDFRWTALIRGRLEGLTDDEYLWEPAEGCLTVRSDGIGGFTLDPVKPSEPPLGNIAWRMAHLAFSLSAHPVAAVAFGPDWPAPQLAAPAATAGEAMARLDRPRRLGLAAGSYADKTVLDIILHIQAETLQRGADLCLLRDLYFRLHRDPEK